MTPFNLQDELVDALRDCTSDLRFSGEDGTTKELNVYKQNIPMREDDDSEDDPYPYIIARLNDGDIDDDENNINVWLIIALCNYDSINEGSRDVIGVEQRIIERFMKNNCLEHFRKTGKIKWSLQDTDTYPFYFGGMEMTFSAYTIGHQNEKEACFT